MLLGREMTNNEMPENQTKEQNVEFVEKSLYEKHRKVYARAISGKFNNLRWLLVFLTQAIFYIGPWIQWG
ncbi:MAG: hypothetical protein ACO3AG_05215, partial [Fluviibacter sp.]